MKVLAETSWTHCVDRMAIQRTFMTSDLEQHTFHYPIIRLVAGMSREAVRMDAEMAYRRWQHRILYRKGFIESWTERVLLFFGILFFGVVVIPTLLFFGVV